MPKKHEEVEVMDAIQASLEYKRNLFDQAAVLKRWCRERFTTDRYLDENEREWYALDRVCRSRPWATNKDTAFPYPFRQATNDMREAEGKWVGDEVEMPPSTRRSDAPCDVIVQVQVPPEFPAEHRVVLFTPEFGSHTSFDKESWSYLEPEEKVDIWIVCWQGWTDWDAMIQQVTRRVLSFADGVNTVWFGQGAGAIVAYEVLKHMESGVQTPNLPVALVVSDCPAPAKFAKSYRPNADGARWAELLAGEDVTDARRARIAADLACMKSYRFSHAGSEAVGVPITACNHEEDPLVSAADTEEWKKCAPEEKFEVLDLGEAEELDEYVLGTRYCSIADPQLLSTLSEMCKKYDRWLEDGVYPDVGNLDGPLPDKVDCVVVGAGISGVYQAHAVAECGKSVLCLDRYHEIGGVWNFYGNDYSRVNTSEVGYRIVDRSVNGLRPNEDHTPRRDIMRDIHHIASINCKDRIRCSIDVTSVDKQPDGTFKVSTRHVKNGTTKTVHAGAVSFNVNRRIGKKREVDWEGSQNFRGDIFYGYGNEMKTVKFWNKKVLVIGAGAFAFENVRTAIELGAKHVTLLGRRDGTTCPKWIDMIAFLRPLDKHLVTNRMGNMISFEVWQGCYKNAGLRPPKCWEDGLLKPNNHTISVSDVAFIAGYHGLFKLQVGEINHFRQDGMGVELKDGSQIDCNMVIKCTGFHLNDEVPKVTGLKKMQPYGLMDFNLNYGAEPLLDGAQFGSAKGGTQADLDLSGTSDELWYLGRDELKRRGINVTYLEPSGNPFGSGQGGPIVFTSKYFAYLVGHPREQKALLKASGQAPQDVVNLWASQIGQYQGLINARLLSKLGRAVLVTD